MILSRRLAVLCLTLLTICACASTIPTGYERTVSSALTDPGSTELGQVFAADIEAHPGQSGLALIPTGETAFRARIGLANQAERTLDLQYYIWEVDDSGVLLAERVMRAADRGVRVRILLDHVTTRASDLGFSYMDHHPNVEIRLFNPLLTRKSQIFEFMADFTRLNHRMHNKAFIADNAAAIVGGRNIGDTYFGVHEDANYRDLDLLAVGPVVQDVSFSFDRYWNSDLAVPVDVLIEDRLPAQEAQEKLDELYTHVADMNDFPYPVETPKSELIARLNALRDDLVWAKAKVLYDEPDRMADDEATVFEELVQSGEEKEHYIVVEAAYVVPDAFIIERAADNKAKGIRQRLLTNSMATNDVAAVHAAYSRYRLQLLRNGVELYELRPDAGKLNENWSALRGRSRAGLHTKVSVADDRVVAVGSFNLDPRSFNLNTEIVLLVESAELAAQVRDYMDGGVLPENSYRVMLETDEETGRERVVWITEVAGEEVRYDSEPGVGSWQRFQTWLLGLLPIEAYL